MTYEWATWLKAALSADPFVAARLVEVSGWQSRGRPPAQFSFAPSGVIEHHTACFAKVGHDPQSCLNGILNGHSGVPGPISQLFISWTPLGTKYTGSNLAPKVYLVAAGRANHAGTGTYSWGAPSGNGSSLGIEVCGPSTWPDEVIELRERVTAAICRNRSWPVSRIMTHHEYATPAGRKIDPSGPFRSQPSLGVTQPWSGQVWRLRVQSHLMEPEPPVPPPPPKPDPQPPTPDPLTMTTGTMWRHPDFLNVWLIGAGAAINVSPEVAKSLTARGVPTIVEAHHQLLKGCLYQSGLDLSDLIHAPKP
jgi:hypothetical protein